MRPDLRQVLALRVALGQIATVRGRRRRCAGRVVGRFVLGLWRAWCSRSCGFIRGVGVARRDQPVGEARGFLLPYAPECVESLSEKPHQRAESLSIRLG